MKDIDMWEEFFGQESGIVVYRGEGQEDSVLVCNWRGEAVGSFPALFMGLSLIFLKKDADEFSFKEKYEVDDILSVIPGRLVTDEEESEYWYEGMSVIWDENYELPRLFGYDVKGYPTIDRDDSGKAIPTSGTVYDFGKEIVIVPHGWN